MSALVDIKYAETGKCFLSMLQAVFLSIQLERCCNALWSMLSFAAFISEICASFPTKTNIRNISKADFSTGNPSQSREANGRHH